MIKDKKTGSLKKHYTALDGLRGFAIILVVFFHYTSAYDFFKFGWSGTELFFVLSGFLISATLAPYIGQQNAIPKFYFNRFLRIIPIYYLFLIIFFGAWFLLTSTQSQLSQIGIFYKKNAVYFFGVLQNWAYIYNFAHSNNHLQHLWSLAVEEQIYLVFPFFVLAFNKKNLFLPATIFLIAIIILSRTIYYFYTKGDIDPKIIYWNTFFRADSFLTGVVTYSIFTQFKDIPYKLIHLTGISSIIILITGLFITGKFDASNAFFSTIGRTDLAITFCYLMWGSLNFPENKVLKLFSHKFFIFIGKISYGIFIFHWPIFMGGFAVLNKFFFKLKWQFSPDELIAINAILSITITLILSQLSFKYYETYFLKWKLKYHR